MLRELQKQKIKSFLLLPSNPWKVLVIDEHTQQILSPLMRVNELRECGITVHFLTSQKRHPISNTPAVYFVSSTNGIAEDVLAELYSEFYLNFSSNIGRKEIEQLGFVLSERGYGLRIKSVYDQFVDFIALQDDMFTLGMCNSFVDMADPETLRKTVTCLMSVFVTLGEIPFVLCKDDDVSMQIGKMLESKIRNTKVIKKTTKRPLLILVNRNYDVITPVQHVWSYNALMCDLLELGANKVSMNDKKTFDLDPQDSLWRKCSNEYFPVVVECVEKELLEYKKEMALRSVDEKTDKKTIQEVLEKAPELAKRNESVNAHISICSEMVEIIKERSIDDFYKVEKGGYTTQELLEVCEKGSDLDILRLAIVMLGTKDADLVDPLLQKRKIKSNVIDFFRKQKRSTTDKAGTLYSQVVTNLMGNVKKLLPVKEQTPVSSLAEMIYGSIKSQDYSSMKVFDPLGSNTIYPGEVSKVVVFCVGGGTYTELKTLKLAEERLGVPVIYGCTEVLNASVFLKQIERLLEQD
ncbi:Sec1-like intracellular trafficking protein [Ordospora colligata]|uniref:Sec1-like intracellular trafficking protein n=1 Tax=Ordospora colligata OC4 TaxID=1354746 RepID=A0A0B2UL50_9MICR|nr:Sec1-like intracellular trafficking protein [Ordospora colligata OC4]KHN70098.1 Sec1-like intracellular trafficking protein [Ordospora colligata OC4]TBU16480.1 Sec1-like intracellular trafficking protein [Ordospora colligata]TBU16665.1 Sec1-like intracellular trafficking protein [Ordospora colligata]TBU19238.1 Sec1-like intracellular trafficking protein [Ordospora colligata]